MNLTARISKLNAKPDDPHLSAIADRDLWVLRDDELGGFWGTKFRKYAAITKYCHENQISQVIATGGINSNNLAAAALLCAEAGIQVTAFAVADHDDTVGPSRGNRMLLRTVLAPEQLILVPREDKSKINGLMRQRADDCTGRGIKSLILEEGGGCTAAVAGCLTLADDVLRNRVEWPEGARPDHVFIDSGTALSAASLAAGLCKAGGDRTTKLHIVQMAGFEEQVHQAFDEWVTPTTGVTWYDVAHFVRVYRPMSPRSYGATSAELFEFIRYMARTHGILTDPVYSAKLFMRAFDLIKGQNCKGRILLVHTGGISGLMGYDVVNR